MTTDETPVPPPKPISKLRDVRITGYLLLMRTKTQPCLVDIAGSDKLYLPVFSSHKKLKAFLKVCPLEYLKISQVTDGREFIESVMPQTTVILDPHRHESGTIRYTQVMSDA